MTNFAECGTIANEKEPGLALLLSLTDSEKQEFIQIWEEVRHEKSIEQRRDYICNRIRCQVCE